MNPEIKFVFFGGEPLAVPVLEKLKTANLKPSLIICNPDRAVGRKQEITPPPTKVWAQTEGIEVFQPTSYKDDIVREKLTQEDWDVFVVVAYNFILPTWLLDLPKHKVINVHPSMLPKLRGASPIRTAIKDNLPEDVGVSIMLLDEKMDTGPILEQEQFFLNKNNWPMPGDQLDKKLADLGGDLLAEVLPAWVSGELAPQEQDDKMATYCGRINKSDSQLTIDPFNLPAGKSAKIAWHIINAFVGIGETYFIYNNKRVKITAAEITNGGTLRILKVTPEGKKETSFSDYLSNLN